MADADRDARPDARSKLATPVGAVVTAVWTAAAFVGLVTGNFQGLEVVSPVMVMFAGYVFGINIVRTGERRISSRSASAPTKRQTTTRRS